LCSINDKTKQSKLANLITCKRLSFRNARKLLNDLEESDINCYPAYENHDHADHIRLAERSFDKTIAAVRIAMNSLGDIINSIEHDWILHEVLLQHKNMLHSQIDILLKEKRKL
jgi:ParB family transcriptional regulator, chromosome partitioning protein